MAEFRVAEFRVAEALRMRAEVGQRQDDDAGDVDIGRNGYLRSNRPSSLADPNPSGIGAFPPAVPVFPTVLVEGAASLLPSSLTLSQRST